MTRHLEKYFILLLLVTFSTFQCQGIKFANVIGVNKFEYAIQSNTVYHFDSAGNTVWAKNFDGQIATSSYPNYLIGIAYVGDAIYVLSIQGYDPPANPHTEYGSVIKMDTSGNVLFIRTCSVFPANSYNLYDIYPSVDSGAWFFDDYSPGFTHIVNAQKINSDGSMGGQIDFWYGSVSQFNSMVLTPDTNYVACVNHNANGTPYGYPTLTKFNESGTVLWRHNYESADSTLNIIGAKSMTIDSSGNIYMFCSGEMISSHEVFGLKLDSAGNVILCKHWPEWNNTYFWNARFENNQVILNVGGEDVVFDTLLNSPCMIGTIVPVTLSNNNGIVGSPQTYSSGSFSPANDTFIQVSHSPNPDHCSVLFEKEVENNSRIFINPNPVTKILNIKTETPGDCTLTVCNALGEIVFRKKINGEFQLDTGSFREGIYFLTLINENHQATAKFIVKH